MSGNFPDGVILRNMRGTT